jgi:hypothetical protein
MVSIVEGKIINTQCESTINYKCMHGEFLTLLFFVLIADQTQPKLHLNFINKTRLIKGLKGVHLIK